MENIEKKAEEEEDEEFINKDKIISAILSKFDDIQTSLEEKDPIGVIDSLIQIISKALKDGVNSPLAKAVGTALMAISESYRQDILPLIDGVKNLEEINLRNITVDICGTQVKLLYGFGSKGLSAAVYINGKECSYLLLPLTLTKNFLLSKLPVQIAYTFFKQVYRQIHQFLQSSKIGDNELTESLVSTNLLDQHTPLTADNTTTLIHVIETESILDESVSVATTADTVSLLTDEFASGSTIVLSGVDLTAITGSLLSSPAVAVNLAVTAALVIPQVIHSLR